MNGRQPAAGASLRNPARGLLVFGFYVGLAVAYMWPLFDQFASRIASDSYDPVLNATILWWNATVLPFTERWWSQPFFYPARGVTAFTETLVGLAPLASPVYWLTGSLVATYNLVFFLSWPLSAFSAYVLVHRLTKRTDAAILGGLAFGFSPYRTSELAHLQSLCVYGLPLALAALHGYLESRRLPWLVLFGCAWLLQSLSNGYYLLFGAVVVGLWVAWFCSTLSTWRTAGPVLIAWALSSVPLVPMLLRYREIHDYYGMRRQFFEVLAFSAHPNSWFHVSEVVRFWHRFVPPSSDDLFPGLAAVVMVTLAVAGVALRTPDKLEPSVGRRFAKRVLAGIVALSAAALVRMLAVGPWSLDSSGHVLFKMNDPFRALTLLLGAGAGLMFLSRRLRRAVTMRRPYVFYPAATVVLAVLACGPVLSTNGHVLLDPAPYRWLMALPGFDQLRVPSRFWMFGVLTLSVSAGMAFAFLTARWRQGAIRVMFLACAAGLIADGWLTALPTEEAPRLWTSLRDSSPDATPVLELPLGPDWDFAAIYHATMHGRRVVNGTSGYDPPHYAPLREGLRLKEPGVLAALASLGPYDIVINPLTDADGGWARYASSAPGALTLPNAEGLAVFRVPAAPREEIRVGAALPIARVGSSRGDPEPVIDHRLDTDWVDAPQHPAQWLLADLDTSREVGGVSLAIEEHAADFPRHVKIELSADGGQWTEVWDGLPSALVFLAAERQPRTGWLRIAFPSRNARYVRVRQVSDATVGWRVPEMEVNAPAAASLP